MSGFNIKKSPTDFEIKSDSFDSYLCSEERLNYLEVPCERLFDDSIATLYVLPSAFFELNEHICWKKRTQTNLSEQGGILVGNVFKDNGTQRICGVVKHVIPSTKSGDATYIQFMHDDWILMYKEFEKKYSSIEGSGEQLKVIGWYHTHPNMPVNMSEIDKNTHISFFSGVWQFSVIFNPQRGIWAAFNGMECKNCNGYIYCLLSENGDLSNISEETDRTQVKISVQSEQHHIATNSSFVIKRRSYAPQNVFQRNTYLKQQVCYIGNNISTSNRSLMLQPYKGNVLPIENTCYYCPLNVGKAIVKKNFVISDVLVRKFASFIDDWSFDSDESIAFIYHLDETWQFIKEISNVKYYTFFVANSFSTNGFIFMPVAGEYFEYLFDNRNEKGISLVVVYSAVRLTYSKFCETYEGYDCALWINPHRINEFEFYIFDFNQKYIKNDFSVRNCGVSVMRQRVTGQTVRINYKGLDDLLRSLSLCYDSCSLETLEYLPTECDGISQNRRPLFISKKLLKKFFLNINRYSKINSDFAVIISYKTADIPSEKQNKVNPWGNEFFYVRAVTKDANNNVLGCSMKESDEENHMGKFSKFALIISNRDVDIYTLQKKLLGHLTAVCLNIESQNYHFYRLF